MPFRQGVIMKRFISLLLSIALVFSFTFSVYAAPSKSTPITSDQEIPVTTQIAATLAMLFVGSNLENTDLWTMDTKISSVDPLFDNQGKITAYCINLETNSQATGYVVVSTDINEPLIQEYAMECPPIYKSSQFIAQTQTHLASLGGEKIYYSGPLNYSTAPKVNQSLMEESSQFSASQTSDFHEKNLTLINEIKETGILDSSYFSRESKASRAGARISDPLDYLHSLYPSWTFSNAGYHNIGDTFIVSYYISENDACAMYAISAILKYHLGSAYSFYSIKNTVLQLFRNSSYSNGNASGNYYLDIGEYKGFTNLCLKHYGLSQTASSSMNSWSIGKSAISRNRPIMLNIWSAPGGNYSDHTVTAYAWTQFVTPSNNITYKFFKVKDGYTTSNVGRYVYVNSMAPSYVTTV